MGLFSDYLEESREIMSVDPCMIIAGKNYQSVSFFPEQYKN
jgi:hypothetical protein